MVAFLWKYLKKSLPMLIANTVLIALQTYLLVIVLMGQMRDIINRGVEAGNMDYILASGRRMLLIILGGLGFLTWSDLISHRFRLKRLRLQTKIILASTAALILLPALYFFFVNLRDTL